MRQGTTAGDFDEPLFDSLISLTGQTAVSAPIPKGVTLRISVDSSENMVIEKTKFLTRQVWAFLQIGVVPELTVKLLFTKNCYALQSRAAPLFLISNFVRTVGTSTGTYISSTGIYLKTMNFFKMFEHKHNEQDD